jgi:hypothetical protein
MASRAVGVRTSLVTCIDAGLIVAASAALVVALGGRTRFDLAYVRVAIRGATNLVAIAAVLGALRLLLDRRSRMLPALPLPDRAAIEEERRRFVSPAPATRDVWIYAAAALLGSLVWIVPHLRDLRQVADSGDPVFSAWRIARLAHQFTHDPRHLFDGNIFYPLPLTLTYSDATVLQGLLGMPFVLAGVEPLIVANALTLVTFPACGLAFFCAGWRLTADPRAGLITGLVGAWYPFRAEHYSHLELLWVMFVPLAIVAGLRMLANPRPATGARFGAAVSAQWLASMYLGVMLLSFLVPFLLLVSIAWRLVPSRRLAVALVVASGIMVPSIAALGLPYLVSRATRGERDPKEVSSFSAAPADYGRAHIRLVTYRSLSGRGPQNERELFPGTSTLALAGAGAVPPLTGAMIATLVAGAVTFDWTLGFKGLTYDDLFKHVPAFRGMRVPARFSAVLGSALALLAGYGARRLLAVARTPVASATMCSALALVVLFDLRLDPLVEPYATGIPSLYSRVSSDMVLVELPAGPQVQYMYFSTAHWARLLGGYSGYPGASSQLTEGWRAFPSSSAIELFRRAGATHLTYNCALETRKDRCDAVFEFLDDNPALEPVGKERWEGADVGLYRYRGQSDSQLPRGPR